MTGPTIRAFASLVVVVAAAVAVGEDAPPLPATRPADTRPSTQPGAAGGGHTVTEDTVFRIVDDKGLQLDTLDKGARVVVLKPGREFTKVQTADGRQGEVPTARLDPPVLVDPPAAARPPVAVVPGPVPRVVPPAPPVVGDKRPTAVAINGAIERAKAYLYASQNADHTWEPAPKPPAAGAAPAAPARPAGWTGQQGGLTALALYALTEAGENRANQNVAPALEWLGEAKVPGHYAAALRGRLSRFQPARTPPNEPPVAAKKFLAAREDLQTMLTGYVPAGPAAGPAAGFYPPAPGDPPAAAEMSASQFAVWGVDGLEEIGLDVPRNYWNVVEAAWRAAQLADGGWPAQPGGNKADPAATAAGIATLALVWDQVTADGLAGGPCRGAPADPNRDKAWAWLDRNAADAMATPYRLWLLERAALAAGRKYVGADDWYAAGAADLLRRQNGDGSWGKDDGAANDRCVPETAFALAFLARGRQPVAVNKLQYDPPHDHAAVMWDERPDDVRHFVNWAATWIETPLSWQAVRAHRPAPDLYDAPILYVASGDAMKLGKEEESRLRQYVEAGGLIVGNADCGAAAFSQSVRDLGLRLFPQYQFRHLPADHPIFVDQNFNARKWKVRPKVEALGNGVRELMVLIPEADFGRAWQGRSAKAKPEAFELMMDVFMYATGHGRDLRYRGEPAVPLPEAPAAAVKADKTIKVARLMVGDNPDPEPAGWRRLATRMHDDHKIDLDVQPVKPAAAGALKGFAVAHLTGTGKLALAPGDRAAIAAFVAAGGTLIVDAAGGDGAFADTAEAELAGLFGAGLAAGPAPPPAGGIGVPLPKADPIYARPEATIDRFAYRMAARFKLGARTNVPRVRAVAVGGRPAVFFSREDLSQGLVGHDVDGVIGYDPETSAAIMRNLVLSAAP